MSAPQPHLSARVLILFASCPHLTLTTAEMHTKFQVHRDTGLAPFLRQLIRRGLVTREQVGTTSVWSAGPALLQELGEEA